MEELFETESGRCLVQTCFPCHGGKKTGGGLRVGTRDELVRGGESGPAVVPHQPGESLLIQAIGHGDEALKMPPGKKLPDGDDRGLHSLDRGGAPWPESRLGSDDRDGRGHLGTGRSSRSRPVQCRPTRPAGRSTRSINSSRQGTRPPVSAPSRTPTGGR